MRMSLRQGIAGAVAIFGTLGSLLACSGSVTPSSSENLGEDQSLLKEGACFGESLGGATSCKPADVWKKYVAESCDSRGLDVGDFTLGAACKDGFDSVKYSCCKAPPKPVPPGPGPNPVPACFGDAQGGPTSCKPAEVWTKYASDLCLAKGSKITQISFADECAKGSFRWTKYECCDGSAPPPPPPPPPVCKTTELGDKTSCKPNGTWKEYAFDFCNNAKLVLTDLSVDGSCGPDSSMFAKVTCCEDVAVPPLPPKDPPPPPPKDPKDPPQPPPPPKDPVPPTPPPQSCTGYSAPCADAATIKQTASDTCAKQGLTLGSLDLGSGACAGPNQYEAKYTCCK